MTATLAIYNNVLKEHFEPYVPDLLSQATEVWDKFMRGTAKWQGRNWNVSLKTGRNTGIGYSDGTLPAAGNQTYSRLQGTAKRLYGTVHLDGVLMEAAMKGGANTIVDWARGELEGLVDDIKFQADTQLISGGTCLGFIGENGNKAAAWVFDGDTDKVAAALAAGGGTFTADVVRMDTYANVVTAQVVNAVTATAAVRTIDFAGAQALNTAPAGTGYALILNDAGVEAALGTADEPIGLYGNLALPTHHGVDRTTATGVADFQSNIIHQDPASGGRAALTRARMKRMLTDIYRASGKYPTELWCGPETIEQYENIVLASVNVSNVNVSGERATKGDAGIMARSSDDTGLTFEGLPIYRKRSLPPGMLVFMDRSKRAWTLEELRKGGFETRGGGILQPLVGTDDSFAGYWKAYHELVCAKPNCQGIITGINII